MTDKFTLSKNGIQSFSREAKMREIVDKSQNILPDTELTSNLFRGLTTLIFGGSKSGKTTLIRHICSSLADGAENVFLFCPTSKEAGYHEYIPGICIHPKPNIELYLKIYKTQVKRTELFNKRNIENLTPLFNICASARQKDVLARVHMILKQAGTKLPDDKKTKLLQLIAMWMDSIIAANKQTIKRMLTNPTELQKLLLLLAGTKKPQTICIWDDCAAFVDFFKSKEFKESSYNGRHNDITHLIASQDINALPTDIRRNAHRTIFTVSSAVGIYFDRKSSGVDDIDRFTAKKAAEEVFVAGPKKGNNYYKLMYIPNMEDGCCLDAKFHAVRANPAFKKKLGNVQEWIESEKHAKIKNKMVSSDPYTNSLLKKAT